MMTEPDFRRKFALYFLDLQEAMDSEGARVAKQAEWERFVEHHLEDGQLPPQARNWKCPRSLKPWQGSGK
jgi:hypothetical protein